jgi:hypothetical protein
LPNDIDTVETQEFWFEVVRNAVAILAQKIRRSYETPLVGKTSSQDV